jgi:hypothetical protein
LLELDREGFSLDLAQYLVSSERILVDAASAVGCSCTGVTTSTTGHSARIAVSSLEPPRTNSPIIIADESLNLTLPIEEAVDAVDGDFPDLPSLPTRPPMAVTPVSALRVRTTWG